MSKDKWHQEIIDAVSTPVKWTEQFDDDGDSVGLWTCNLHALNAYVWKEAGKYTGWVDVYNRIEGVTSPIQGRPFDTLEKAQQKALDLAEILMTKTWEQLPDNCAMCEGTRGGTRGNENVIEGVVTCDYCSVR